MTVGGECHAGDDGEVDVGVVCEEGTCGFGYAKVGGCGQVGVACVGVELKVGADDGGEKHGVTFGVELADEGKGVDLVGQGMIEENLGAILLCW